MPIDIFRFTRSANRSRRKRLDQIYLAGEEIAMRHFKIIDPEKSYQIRCHAEGFATSIDEVTVVNIRGPHIELVYRITANP
jgi:hypothetical protein